MRNGNSHVMNYPFRSAKDRGFAYIFLLLSVAMVGLLSAASLSAGSQMARREAERGLLATGTEFELALRSYANLAGASQVALPGGRGPHTLEELLRDARFPAVKRHLRQIYADPLTGRSDWGVISEPGGAIVGIFSIAPGTPIQRTGFGPSKPHFENADSYAAWVFGLPNATLPNNSREILAR